MRRALGDTGRRIGGMERVFGGPQGGALIGQAQEPISAYIGRLCYLAYGIPVWGSLHLKVTVD